MGMSCRADLRRVDWRFLLPMPEHGQYEHLLLLGAPAELPERLLTSGFAARISTNIPEEPVDVVAILNSDLRKMKEAVARLQLGGAFYCEVDRRKLPSALALPQQMEQRLQRLGLCSTGAYWAAPTLEQCRCYVPLDCPEAIDWYLHTLFTSGSPLLSGLRTLLSVGSRRWRHTLSLLAPHYVITATAGAPSAQPSVLAHTKLAALSGEYPAPRMRPLLLTSGQDDGSRLVIFPFQRGRSLPVAAVKTATRADFNLQTEREHQSLIEVQAQLPEELRQTLPSPLHRFHWGGLAVSVQSCAPGAPLTVTSGHWMASRDQKLADLCLAANWLMRFQSAASSREVFWDKTALEVWIDTPLQNYARQFALTERESRLFEQVRKQAWLLRGRNLPLVPTHFDFAPWNLYRDGDRLTVLDWELGHTRRTERLAPAGYDLLYFVTYWYFLVHRLHERHQEQQGLVELFAPRHNDRWPAALIGDILHRYCTTLNLPMSFLPIMLVYVWVEQALYQEERKRTLNSSLKNPRAQLSAIAYLDVLAAQGDRLFTDFVGHGVSPRRLQGLEPLHTKAWI